MKILPILLFALILSTAARAQSYGATKLTTLAGTAEVMTIQGAQPVNVRLLKVIVFRAFDASCSVACTITLERDGAAATTTALTPVQLNGEQLPPTALAFSASNAGVGTVLAQYTLPAGGQIAINLGGKQLNSGFQNVTIRTSAITGTVNINIQWAEQ